MKNYHSYILETVGALSNNPAFAEAELCGSPICPSINGATVFYRHPEESGIFVVTTIFGLPDNDRISHYEMHVRGGYFPEPLKRNESQNTLAKGFRRNMLSLPDVHGNGGFAFSLFYTEEVSECDLLGRSVSIFHKGVLPSHPSEALACGLILPIS